MEFFIFDNAGNVSAKKFDNGRAAVNWFLDHWQHYIVSLLSCDPIILCDPDKNFLMKVNTATCGFSYWSEHEWIYIYPSLDDILENSLNYFITVNNNQKFGLSSCDKKESILFALKFSFLFIKEKSDFLRLSNYNDSVSLFLYGEGNYLEF